MCVYVCVSMHERVYEEKYEGKVPRLHSQGNIKGKGFRKSGLKNATTKKEWSFIRVVFNYRGFTLLGMMTTFTGGFTLLGVMTTFTGGFTLLGMTTTFAGGFTLLGMTTNSTRAGTDMSPMSRASSALTTMLRMRLEWSAISAVSFCRTRWKLINLATVTGQCQEK